MHKNPFDALPTELVRKIAANLPYHDAVHFGLTRKNTGAAVAPDTRRRVATIRRVFSKPRAFLKRVFLERARRLASKSGSHPPVTLTSGKKTDTIVYQGTIGRSGGVEVVTLTDWRRMKNPHPDSKYLSQVHVVLRASGSGAVSGNPIWKALWRQVVKEQS